MRVCSLSKRVDSPNVADLPDGSVGPLATLLSPSSSAVADGADELLVCEDDFLEASTADSDEADELVASEDDFSEASPSDSLPDRSSLCLFLNASCTSSDASANSRRCT